MWKLQNKIIIWHENVELAMISGYMICHVGRWMYVPTISFFFFWFVYFFFLFFWLLCSSVLGVAFFVWLSLCVLCWFEMPFAPNALAFTLHATSQGMSRVFTFIPTLSPKLARLFCCCRCPFFLCYTLILSPWFLGLVLNPI